MSVPIADVTARKHNAIPVKDQRAKLLSRPPSQPKWIKDKELVDVYLRVHRLPKEELPQRGTQDSFKYLAAFARDKAEKGDLVAQCILENKELEEELLAAASLSPFPAPGAFIAETAADTDEGVQLQATLPRRTKSQFLRRGSKDLKGIGFRRFTAWGGGLSSPASDVNGFGFQPRLHAKRRPQSLLEGIGCLTETPIDLIHGGQVVLPLSDDEATAPTHDQVNLDWFLCSKSLARACGLAEATKHKHDHVAVRLPLNLEKLSPGFRGQRFYEQPQRTELWCSFSGRPYGTPCTGPVGSRA
eukprot:6243341-Amphidinium_carterae.1